jgi:hypothetical protein
LTDWRGLPGYADQEQAVLTYHSEIEVTSGTPITINGTLCDAAGNLLDVTNATLAWGLLDPDGNPVTPDATITKTDAVNGVIQVEVPATALPPGRYTDSLQATEGAKKELFWIGNILIIANPFSVADMTP